MEVFGLITLGHSLASSGHPETGLSAAEKALEISSRIGGFHEDSIHATIARAALGCGDPLQARAACEAALQSTFVRKELFTRSLLPMAEAQMCCGDLGAARRWADDTVAVVPGAFQVWALTARARVALAQSEFNQAEQDVHNALAVADHTGGYRYIPDTLECLAAVDAPGRSLHAARLLGATHGIRQRHDEIRFTVFQQQYDATVAAVIKSLGQEAFDTAWAEGAALTTKEAIAFAQRGRGERKRPASGWESLTPAESDVVCLLGEGLSNKDIAARLFISPRTVQTHLTHIYSKLNLSSRVQVIQEAARHT
jgi:DNA-binding CsgD family transcriptional regulator